MFKIVLPNLDENVTEYTVGRWLKSVGDAVEASEPILEVETDKVTMEIVAEVAGELAEIVANEGDVLQPGAPLATLTTEKTPTPVASSPTPSSPPRPSSPRPSPSPNRETRLTPVVARMVSEHDLDVAQIEGTGKNGRVTKKDVVAYLKDEGRGKKDERKSEERHGDAATRRKSNSRPNTPSPTPSSPPRPTGSTQKLPMTGMRRSIAEHMVRSVQTSPHVTTLFEFDFGAVAQHRKANKKQFAQEGIKLTYMAYVALATVSALKAFPIVNSVFYEDGIELQNEIHLGMMTAVPGGGLFAPVIQHADGYNLRGMARAIENVAEKARNGQLTPSDMQGGTFSISNHGAAGSLAGTPIIYQPQAGILGVGKIEERVKVINGGIHIRPCAYISFSFDHRVMDGAEADGFVSEIKQIIENWAE